MTKQRRLATPPGVEGIPQLAGLNKELADAFSGAVFGLLEHNCSCPSAKFVRLLVKKRKEMFKGGEVAHESDNPEED
ncbi:hypothetical protein ES708_30712 [subsurface metagenome]